jgi:inhibitor of cysteine peptidase
MNNNLRAIIFFALMLSNADYTLAGEYMRLTENDSGKTVEINVGDDLEVVLPGMPTTGYIWELSPPDSSVLKPGKADFFADDKAIGSSGMEVISFHAIAVGKSQVKLIFHRPFEHNTPASKTFEVIVIIKK